MEYGILSILPPLLAIVLAIRTKEVYLSLLLGVFMGWLVIADWNLWEGFLQTINAFVDVFSSAGNTRTILFSWVIGALIYFIQRSGGVQGFINLLDKKLDGERADNRGKSSRKVKFWAMATGILVFVESNISVLTVGTLYRPVFDRLKISREYLAYLADSTSAPISVLLPFNAWGAFIMGLLLEQGIENTFGLMMQSIAFNFYPIMALLILAGTILSGRHFGPMKKADKRVKNSGELLSEGAVPMVSDELTSAEKKEGIAARSFNMIVPLLIMICMMPVMLTLTGWEHIPAEMQGEGFFRKAGIAIGNGSGSLSVLVSVTLALLGGLFMYYFQGFFNIKESIDGTLKGMAGMMPLALLMVFAFALNAVCVELGTGEYVASIAGENIGDAWIPALVFVLSALIAFSTGTSWGTFAIMVGIAMPLAASLGLSPALLLAAALGGGVFGDHCSPISDTTIISSMASATDHIDHVRTQLPYALLAGGIAVLGYFLAGLMM